MIFKRFVKFYSTRHSLTAQCKKLTMASETHGTVDMYTVDSFTAAPFCGNPAAICCLTRNHEFTEEIMQKIAAEMNLSETAFVKPCDDLHTLTSGQQFKLRWFTPTVEVALCGHATLATAAILFNKYNNVHETLEFETLSGMLKAKKTGSREVTLDFPVNHPVESDKGQFCDLISTVIDADLVQEVFYQADTKKLLLRLYDEVPREQLEKLKPDFGAMIRADVIPHVKGVIVTLKSKDGVYDFVSRYFAPWVGINEDPVTGSAHTVLASYWASMLGKSTFNAYQCSARGGSLKVELRGDRVFLTGDTVIVMQAQFTT